MRLVCAALLFGLLGCTVSARSAAPDAVEFARANGFYADGKFAEAVKVYEAQVARGNYSANLFYNLANAQFRLGERGRAVLDYERALVLQPNHAEAAANLAFLQRNAPAWPIGGWAGWLDVDGWTWLAAAGGWLAIVGLGAAAFRARSRGLMLAAAFAGAAVCGISVWAINGLHGGAKNPARAVVLADDTRALYAPADNSKAIVTLPAGSEVLLISEQGAWDYVQLGDGIRGWISAARVEKVIPPAVRAAAG